ncbi:MAG TPA: cytochrome P450 [Solirubrobacteraceae bacterium]|jgi:cytochrome P450
MPRPESTGAAPHRSSIDLFSDAVLADPYPHYRKLRETSSAVYLTKCDAWALTQYADVRRALSDWRVFSSTDGIALSRVTNAATDKSPLAVDPPAHRHPRRVLQGHLSPMSVHDQAIGIQRRAKELVAHLAKQERFDAMRDLAAPFALSTLADHMGLPADSRDFLIDWADAAFDIMGPDNERTRIARAHLGKLGVYLLNTTIVERLSTTGAGRAIYAAGTRGDITPEACTQLVAISLLASIPTTTASIGNAVSLFARHPDQWECLRRDPRLVENAVEEILRLESPIQWFSRVLRERCDIGDVSVPAGARVLLLFGAANRDPNTWGDPDTFDITRTNPVDHLAFGHGLHSCMGQGLARAEIAAVLTALVAHVERWHVREARRKLNNVIRGLDSLPVTINASVDPGRLAPPRRPDVDTAADVTNWQVAGAVRLAKLRRHIELPSGATFSGSVDIVNGAMTGSFDLLPLAIEMRILGIGVRIASELIPTGSFDGDAIVTPDGKIKLSATSRAVMHIRSIAIDRLQIPLKCRTATPIEMPLEASGMMRLDFRPEFLGIMAIPRFTGNGPIAWLATMLVSGSGNAFHITLELPGQPTGDRHQVGAHGPRQPRP